MIRLKKEADLRELRASGKILAFVLKSLVSEAKEGTALKELDGKARKLLKETGAEPAFLGYKPVGAARAYPAAICTSVNETVVHGLPSDYVLKNGDILKIDFGVDYNGYFTDAAATVGIGEVDKLGRKLIESTRRALEEAVKACRVSKHLGDIGWAVESTAKEAGFHVIRSLTGHGVGFELHEDPTIYNYGRRGEGIELKAGMVLAIEPMVSVGTSEVVQKSDDSFVTKDGSLSAHFEHTVAITENGPEVLTPY